MILPKEDLLKIQGGQGKQLSDTILDLMIEMKNWDIGDMPIPTFLALCKRLKEHNDEMKREMKCHKR